MLAVAAEYGIVQTYSMCPPEDIPALRHASAIASAFNGPIHKKKIDEPDDCGLSVCSTASWS